MQGFQSNAGARWRLALLPAALIFVGCQSTQQSSLFGNPFLAPHRVPPPTTRALVPGTAQPYYPGDQVPVLQDSASIPSAGLDVAQNVPPNPVSNSSAPAIPSMAGTTGTAPRLQRVSLNTPPDPVHFPVQQASAAFADTGFTEPATPAAATAPLERPDATAPAASSEAPQYAAPVAWRNPGIADPQSIPTGTAQQFHVAPVPFAQSAPSYSPAQYSGPIQPSYPASYSSAPRVRMPGYSQLGQPTTGVTGSVPHGISTAPAGGSVPQTVRITELPSYGVHGAALATQDAASWQTPIGNSATPANASADGFRPRADLR